MVVIKLQGGLGNQMFQYALALAYLKQGRLVKFDLSSYQKVKCHNGFELDRVFQDIKIPIAGKRDFFYYAESYFDEKGSKLFKLKRDRCIYVEPEGAALEYEVELLSFDNVYLNGYWQNVNYFSCYESALRKQFSFVEIENDDTVNRDLLERIKTTNSISIHIRRGDYLLSPIYKKLTLKYYKKAIELIKERVENAAFYVFSDDLEFAMMHFSGKNSIIVSNNNAKKSFRDLQLMAACKHNIIANSTFSWWAAWLNRNEKKEIITPEDWFVKARNMTGLLSPGWLKI